MRRTSSREAAIEARQRTWTEADGARRRKGVGTEMRKGRSICSWVRIRHVGKASRRSEESSKGGKERRTPWRTFLLYSLSPMLLYCSSVCYMEHYPDVAGSLEVASESHHQGDIVTVRSAAVTTSRHVFAFEEAVTSICGLWIPVVLFCLCHARGVPPDANLGGH